MTIPTSGTYTSEQVRAEWGFATPFTSSQVSSAAGLNTPWNSEQLRGKSNGPTVTIQITQNGSEAVGTGRRRDYFTATINWSGSVTPTSYSWSWGGYSAALASPSARTCRFTGQSYSPLAANGYDDSNPFCNVVIGGVTYSVAGPAMSLTADGGI
ncbi:hypothetical protein [Brevundimonas nasdae]|uniref:Uncharacterized protein n=1 Tax=Brevundimonas nasdae TaxID=172043 RepID=A0ACD4VKB9_9CAUL|nr:hypothetical protein [Brevundimonas nasdae]WOB78468.1 hypothetical protein PZA08_14365 [Brevundimonas nasdae]